jgi:signal transduction histidine kinase
MRRFDKLFIAVIAVLVALIALTNVFLLRGEQDDRGRPHRVEVNRLAQKIDAGQAPDLGACDYVTGITKYSDNPTGFYHTNSDYVVHQIQGELYRFDYRTAAPKGADFVAVNTALAGMTVVVLGVLVYLRQRILRPFQELSDVPYELSKGNLTLPVKETKNRFFGRFVWGVDLLRENMEQQKKRELALQKEKKTLLLSLSHDIKTPLSAIKLYAKALSRGLYTDKEKQQQIIGSIDAKADEIEGFVSQIIQASNEDFLSLEVNMGEFYLTELMTPIQGYYREKLSLVKIDFKVGAYTNCLVRGDLDRSIEVLQNVMENAIKYGDGVKIQLEVSEEDGCTLITVRNSGCALPQTELPHVFDSFWRGSNADRQPGSGLGLYICRQIMHKMNGEIFAQIEGGDMAVTAVFSKA